MLGIDQCPRGRHQCGGGGGVRRDGIHRFLRRDGEGVAAGVGKEGRHHPARGDADADSAGERRDGAGGGAGVRGDRVLRVVGRAVELLGIPRRRPVACSRWGAPGAQDGGAVPRGGRELGGERVGRYDAVRVAKGEARGPHKARGIGRPRGARQVCGHRGGPERWARGPAVGGVQRELGQFRQAMAGFGACIRGGRAEAAARAGWIRGGAPAVAPARARGERDVPVEQRHWQGRKGLRFAGGLGDEREEGQRATCLLSTCCMSFCGVGKIVQRCTYQPETASF